MKPLLGLAALGILLVSRAANAQEAATPASAEPPAAAPPPPADAPPPPPALPSAAPVEVSPQPANGREVSSSFNRGFQMEILPGAVIVDGDASFAFNVRFGYGFDTGSVIIVPGLELATYFTDPRVDIALASGRFLYPIGRFAPFVDAGVGIGFADKRENQTTKAKTGLGLLGGIGAMAYVTENIGLGVRATYQGLTGGDFKGFGVGPIVAIGF